MNLKKLTQETLDDVYRRLKALWLADFPRVSNDDFVDCVHDALEYYLQNKERIDKGSSCEKAVPMAYIGCVFYNKMRKVMNRTKRLTQVLGENPHLAKVGVQENPKDPFQITEQLIFEVSKTKKDTIILDSLLLQGKSIRDTASKAKSTENYVKKRSSELNQLIIGKIKNRY